MGSDWQRHFIYRKETWKTTWKLKLSVVLLLLVIVWVPRRFWAVKIGNSLTCEERTVPSDALLLENFDPDYLVFERAAALERAGVAGRVFVPVQAAADPQMPNIVSKGIAEIMARVAHIPGSIELIPMDQIEPISLNAANQIRDVLVREHVKSVVVVTPGFRSRRSLLVYSTVLKNAGITVGCVPVFGTQTITNWNDSWHGMQEVALQYAKLLYYRFYVLL